MLGSRKNQLSYTHPCASAPVSTAEGEQNMEVNGRIQTQKGTSNRHEAPLLFEFYVKLVTHNCPLSNTS